jgi:ABC-2 type transport system permease protein
MIRLLRSAFVIGRRDFSATVMSKAFIFFLLSPVFPVLLGGVFGGIGASVASRNERSVVAVISSTADFARLDAARDQLVGALGDGAVIDLVRYAPEKNLLAQERKLLASRTPPVGAVLTGPLAKPHLTGAAGGSPGIAGQLRLLLAAARSPELGAPPNLRVSEIREASAPLVQGRAETALYSQMLLFFLTVLLAGMVMSQLIEEKSNKIIEVIAAAVPIDAMFLGKLFAMLVASIVGVVVWVSAGALLIQLVSHGGLRTLPPPAIGWPGFLVLGVAYFATNYLLIGAIMLTIGGQASTAREVQILAMPATFGQFLVFGLATKAIGSPNSTMGIAAAIFPLSSPMAMLARAAQQPEWWPHLAAFAWQLLWIALILRAAAQLFRKTVLKSGPRTKWWRRAIGTA